MDAIRVEGVSKVYPIYRYNADRVKELFHPLRKKYHTDFYALRNISFRVEKGETVGIIGTNGSGKSTMLKIISNVLRASEGTVTVNGKVSSLLELGVGFDEDYTGLENIYINGSIMGYSREEMADRVPEILDFADIGEFIYQPVKTYSSGMLVRLAFSLAINVEPEILVVDEALAVGDIYFQAKCFHKLDEIKKRGTTILFVSHDLGAVKKLCSRALWIEKGTLRMEGSAERLCEAYLAYQIQRQNQENSKISEEQTIPEGQKNQIADGGTSCLRLPRLADTHTDIISGTGKAEILSAFFRNEKGEISRTIQTDHICAFCMAVRFQEPVFRPLFGVELETNKGVRVYGVNNYMLGRELETAEPGKIYYIEFRLLLPRLHSGHYLITPAVASGIQDCHVVHQRIHNFDLVIVENEGFDDALIELDAEFSVSAYGQEEIELQ